MTEAHATLLREFAKAVLRMSWDGNIDGGDIEELAIKHDLLVPVVYDPEVHGDHEYADKGDTIHMFSDWLKTP